MATCRKLRYTASALQEQHWHSPKRRPMLVNSMLIVPASAMLVFASDMPALALPARSFRGTYVTGRPELVLNATNNLHKRACMSAIAPDRAGAVCKAFAHTQQAYCCMLTRLLSVLSAPTGPPCNPQTAYYCMFCWRQQCCSGPTCLTASLPCAGTGRLLH
jgi:hypothetical protein